MKASEHRLKYLEDLSRIDLANLFTDEGRKAIHESETGYSTALILELRLLDLLKKLRDTEVSLLRKLHELNERVFEHNNIEIKALIKRLIWLISFKSTAHKAPFDSSTGILWLILLYYNIEKEEYILSNELEHLLKENEIENLVRGKFQSVINDENKINLFLKSELRVMNLLIAQAKQQLSILTSLEKLASINVEKLTKNDVQVLIVGGGLAGVSTAYHLTRANVNVMLVEAGRIGRGSDDMISGTCGPSLPRHTKLITIPYESDYESFVKKHRKSGKGKISARIYLEINSAGLEIQKSIGRSLGPDVIRQLGTIMIGEKEDFEFLKKEYRYYRSMGFWKNSRFVSKKEIKEIFNTERFEGGLYLPEEAIADQDAYVKLLKEKHNLNIVENVKVIEVKPSNTGVTVKTDKAGDITADYLVFATNGFWVDKNLRGLIKRRWTYQISYQDYGQNSPNISEFAWIYSWGARQDNVLFVGGGDDGVVGNNFRFPRNEEKAKSDLIKWVNDTFPQTRGKQPLEFHFGIFVYTKDEIPIVGRFSSDSRIFYIVGCNGTGHSTLSYAASLMPGIMGYAPLNEQQRRMAEFLSPTRVTLK